MRWNFIIIILFVHFGISGSSQSFTSSNLPIVVINTNGQTIADDPKITAHMGIIYNGATQRSNVTDPFNVYDGDIGIELRGNSTQSFSKKPYGFETRTTSGEDVTVSLLGLPPESDWILSAAFIDKTLLRDPLAYELSRRMGNWASHTVHCELVLNGEYQGVYILEEKIKRDKNRVNIARLNPDDNSGTDVTGGYIFEVAQSGEEFGKRRRYVYPKASDITPQQRAYIQNYDDAFRDMMMKEGYDDPVSGYGVWIDVQSFIDEILMQELTKNADAYGWSSYFHKDKNGKLKAGPVWDFDQGFSNSTFNEGPNYTEWLIEKSETSSWLKENYPPFWIRLFREKNFRRALRLRWTSLRETVWTTESIMAYIDSTAQHLNEAQQRNFQRWNILGKFVWRTTPGFEQRTTYVSEVNYLKIFLNNRLNWMDSQLKLIITDAGDELVSSPLLQSWPNPFSNETNITYHLTKPDRVTIDVYDVMGKHVRAIRQDVSSEGQVRIDATVFAPGVYYCILRTSSGKTATTKMIVQR